MVDRIHVGVRVRKLIHREKDELVQWEVQGMNTLTQIDKNRLPVGEAPFVFDRVFNPNENTGAVYEELCKPIVNSVMEGFNGTIFAYGQTSSGKTYTMRGDDKDHGVIVHTIAEIFEGIENTPDREFLLRVSYMEIYNEKISDLLSKNIAPMPKGLKIMENTDGQVFVANLTEEMVKSAEDVMIVMQRGEEKRHFGETCMNEKSSRSHAIFRMIIESRPVEVKPNEVNVVHVSHLNLVDLAGSERTGQMGTSGDRFKEGVNINKSLLMLGQVISNLSEGEGSFVSFRESKLTRILQNSLGGNAKTAIICTVTPVSVEQTRSTLNFASRAKKIKNKPVVNEILSDAALLNMGQKKIRQLEMELQEMKKCDKQSKVDAMEKQLQEKEHMIRELKDRLENLTNHVLVSSRTHDEAHKLLTRKYRRETWCAPLRRNQKSILGVAVSRMTTVRESDEKRARLSSTFEEVMAKETPEMDLNGAEDSFHTKDFRDSEEFLAEMNQISDVFSQDKNFSQIDTRKQQEPLQILALERKVEELEKQLKFCEDCHNNLEVDHKQLKEFTTSEKQLYGEQPISILDQLKFLEKTNRDTQLLLQDSNKQIRKLQTEKKGLQDELELERERICEEKLQFVQINKETQLDCESRGRKLLEMEEKMKNMDQDQKDFVGYLESKWKFRESELCKQLDKAYSDLSKWEKGDPLSSQRISEYERNLKSIKEELLTSEKVTAGMRDTISLNSSKIAELQKENSFLKDTMSEKHAVQDSPEVSIQSSNDCAASTQTSFMQNADVDCEMEMHKMRLIAEIVEELLIQLKGPSVVVKKEKENHDQSCEIFAQVVASSLSDEKVMTDLSVRTEAARVSLDTNSGKECGNLVEDKSAGNTRLNGALHVQSVEVGSLYRNVALLQGALLSVKEEFSTFATEKEKLASSLSVAEVANKELDSRLASLMKRERELLDSVAKLKTSRKCKPIVHSDNCTQTDYKIIESEEFYTVSAHICAPESDANANLLEAENALLKSQITKYESEIAEFQNQYQNILEDRSNKEICITQLEQDNDTLMTKYTERSEEFESVENALLEVTSEKDAIQRQLLEAYLVIDDLTQRHSTAKVELKDLEQKLQCASSTIQIFLSEKELLENKCIQLENESKTIDSTSQETVRQLQMDREALVEKQQQLLKHLRLEKGNLMHALLENDEVKKELVEIRLVKDDANRACSSLSLEAVGLKGKLNTSEEKVKDLEKENKKLHQRCSSLGDENKYRDEVELLKSELHSQITLNNESNGKLSEELKGKKKALSDALVENETLQKMLLEAKLVNDNLRQQLVSEAQKLKEQEENVEKGHNLAEEKNILYHRCSKLEAEMEYKLKEIEILQQEVLSKERHLQELGRKLNGILEESEQIKRDSLDQSRLLKALQEENESKAKMIETQMKQISTKENEIQDINSKLENASEKVVQLNQELSEKINVNERLEKEIARRANTSEIFHEQLLEKENELSKLGKKFETTMFHLEQLKACQPNSEEIQLLKEENENLYSKLKYEEEVQEELKEDLSNLQISLFGTLEWEKEAVTLKKKLDVKESALQDLRTSLQVTSIQLRDLKEDNQAKVGEIDLLRKNIQSHKNNAERMEQDLHARENTNQEQMRKLEQFQQQIQRLEEEKGSLTFKLKDEEETLEELKEDLFDLQMALNSNRMWETEAVCLQKELDELKTKTAKLVPVTEGDALSEKYAALQDEKERISNEAKILRKKYDQLKEYYNRVFNENKMLESRVQDMGDYFCRKSADAVVQTEELGPRKEDALSLRNEVSMLQQKRTETERSLVVQREELESRYSLRLQEQLQQVNELQQENARLISEKEKLLKASVSFKQYGVRSLPDTAKNLERKFGQNIEVPTIFKGNDEETIKALRKRLLDQEAEIERKTNSNQLLKNEIKKRNAREKNQTGSADGSTKKDDTAEENWDLIEYGGSGFINRLQVCQMQGIVERLEKENRQLKLKLKQMKENIPVDTKPPLSGSSNKIPKAEAVPMTADKESDSKRWLTPSIENQLNVVPTPTLLDDVTLTVLERPRLKVFSSTVPEKKKEDDDCKTQ